MSVPSASVILSTYNQPDWLEKALLGYAAQRFTDFEIVIADDGSRAETRERLDELRVQLPFPLKHVWHEDSGFRKCTILNRAIAASVADYLVFSDGDCIPRADLLAVHMAARAPKRFLSGGYFKLPLALSQKISADDIASGRFADPDWLSANGLSQKDKMLKLRTHGWRAALFNALTPARASWNGHNASAWKADILSVNGFDERMQYGGEDRELGERLVHAGMCGRQIRYSAIVLHLDHERGYVKPEMIAANRLIRAQTRRARAVWTAHGIDKRPAP
jgi:glycosyltransferase involved in cell wall biosynthesis